MVMVKWSKNGNKAKLTGFMPSTVQSRFHENILWSLRSVTNDILRSNNSEICGKNPDIPKPRYGRERILPDPLTLRYIVVPLQLLIYYLDRKTMFHLLANQIYRMEEIVRETMSAISECEYWLLSWLIWEFNSCLNKSLMVLLTRNETPTQVIFIRLGILGVENRKIKAI